MDTGKYLLTILTPTYNRRDRLPALFESLQNQTVYGFQWLVIDDGSNDNTEDYIRGLRTDRFVIEYHRKENGGKHTALNYAHPYIKGDYVCIVDSDDYLTNDAVQSIFNLIKQYGANEEIACYSFQKGEKNGEAMVKNVPDEPVVSNHIDFRLNGNRPGDCCEVEKTSVFREFPFPEFPGEKFISEGYLWVNIGLKYNTVYINKVIYMCEYLEGGLTNSGRKMRIKSPKGGMETCNVFLSAKDKPRLNLKLTIKYLWLYICCGKFAGYSFSDMKEKCNRKGLLVINYPAGLLMYKLWSVLYR